MSPSIADLTDAEAASLGTWEVRLSRTLRAVTGCSKTYMAQFAECEDQHIGEQRQDELAAALRAELDHADLE